MAEETRNPTSPATRLGLIPRAEPSQTATAFPSSIPSTATPAAQGQASPEFLSFLGDSAKYAAFGVFLLYAIGFLIWHAYLGQFGVSSMEFLQAEYFSVALCYLMLVVTFALPPALLWKR